MNKETHELQEKVIDFLEKTRIEMSSTYNWVVNEFAKLYRKDYGNKELTAEEAIELYQEERNEIAEYGEDAIEVFKEKHNLLDKVYQFIPYYQEGLQKIDEALEDVCVSAFLDGNDDLLKIDKTK